MLSARHVTKQFAQQPRYLLYSTTDYCEWWWCYTSAPVLESPHLAPPRYLRFTPSEAHLLLALYTAGSLLGTTLGWTKAPKGTPRLYESLAAFRPALVSLERKLST